MSEKSTKIPELFAEHFGDPYHRGECEHATHFSEHAPNEATSQESCSFQIELRVGDDDVIQEAWFDSQGCQWCEGFLSCVCESMEGRPLDDVRSESFEQLLARLGQDRLQQELARQGSAHQLLPGCVSHAFQLLAQLAALHECDGDGHEPFPFGGPSLREEC